MVKNLPALGFNTWNTFGENINEQLVRDTADAMVSTGGTRATPIWSSTTAGRKRNGTTATGWCPVMKSSPPA